MYRKTGMVAQAQAWLRLRCCTTLHRCPNAPSAVMAAQHLQLPLLVTCRCCCWPALATMWADAAGCGRRPMAGVAAGPQKASELLSRMLAAAQTQRSPLQRCRPCLLQALPLCPQTACCQSLLHFHPRCQLRCQRCCRLCLPPRPPPQQQSARHQPWAKGLHILRLSQLATRLARPAGAALSPGLRGGGRGGSPSTPV